MEFFKDHHKIIIYGLVGVIVFVQVLLFLRNTIKINKYRKAISDTDKLSIHTIKVPDRLIPEITPNEILSKLNTNQSIVSEFSEHELEKEKKDEVVAQVDEAFGSAFYAGRLTDDGFSRITGIIDERNTIFQLEYVNEDRTRAEFEVVFASEFMKNIIIKSPLVYLSSACIFENEYNSLTSEVITKEKGVAEWRNGHWCVDEQNKATIVFH